MPALPDTEKLPIDVLHSATVETLLNQNQDLMARLSVNIRRVTDLEIAIRNRDDSLRLTEAQKEALKEEYDVVSEKYRALKTGTDKIHLEKRELEKNFAELNSRNQEIQARLQDENFYFRGLLLILRNYQRRIRKFVRPLVRKQRQEIAALAARCEAADNDLIETREWMQAEIVKRQSAIDRLLRYRRRIRAAARPLVFKLRGENKTLREQAARDSTALRAMEIELDKIKQILQDQQGVFDRDQGRLVDYHESRWQELSEKNDKLVKEHGEQTDKLVAIHEEQTGNLKAELERLSKDYSIAIGRIRELETEKDKLVTSGAESENRAIRAERTQTELEKKRVSEHNEQDKEIRRLREQLEKLALESEELRARDAAAAGLNRRLSQDMNQLRKECEQLRLRIRSVKTEETKTVFVPPPPQQSSNNAPLEKIERILAEIQTGHSESDIKSKLERERSTLEDLI